MSTASTLSSPTMSPVPPSNPRTTAVIQSTTWWWSWWWKAVFGVVVSLLFLLSTSSSHHRRPLGGADGGGGGGGMGVVGRSSSRSSSWMVVASPTVTPAVATNVHTARSQQARDPLSVMKTMMAEEQGEEGLRVPWTAQSKIRVDSPSSFVPIWPHPRRIDQHGKKQKKKARQTSSNTTTTTTTTHDAPPRSNVALPSPVTVQWSSDHAATPLAKAMVNLAVPIVFPCHGPLDMLILMESSEQQRRRPTTPRSTPRSPNDHDDDAGGDGEEHEDEAEEDDEEGDAGDDQADDDPSTPPSSPLPPPRGTTIVLRVRSPDETLDGNTNEAYTLSVRSPRSSSSSSSSPSFGAAAADEPSHLESPSRVTITIDAATVYGMRHGLETLAQVILPQRRPKMTPFSPTAPYPGRLVTRPPHWAASKKLGGDLPYVAPLTGCHGYKIVSNPLTIRDWPRVAYRGLLVDTSRHFIPIPTLELLLDGMAATKLNVLHLHLTDSHGFPLHIPGLPLMALSHDEAYTRSDIEHLVSYAQVRGIRVIPEIDIPGHTYFAAKEFPAVVNCPDRTPPFMTWGHSPPTGQLNPAINATYDLLNKIFREVSQWFPDSQFHLGHDEINANCWGKNELPPDFPYAGNVNLSLAHFHRRLQPIVNTHLPSKTRIMWEEPFFQFDARDPQHQLYHVVQLWKTFDKAIVDQVRQGGKQLIVSYYKAWYFDCGHGSWLANAGSEEVGWCIYRNWQAVYGFEPFGHGTRTIGWRETKRGGGAGTSTTVSYREYVPSLNQSRLPSPAADAILGGEACLWTERMDESNLLTRAFPRALAFAERAWSHPGVDPGVVEPASTGGGQGGGGPAAAWDDVMNRLTWARDRLLNLRGIPSSPLHPAWCNGRADRCR